VVAQYYYPNAVGVDVTVPLAGKNVWHVRIELTSTNELHNYFFFRIKGVLTNIFRDAGKLVLVI
jgi:hypothetical protein